MERLLHYVWKYKLYSPGSLVTTEGLPVSVIDPGIQNTNAGPDFFNAKVKIGEIMWAGCVEIHNKSSDWRRHRHDKNIAYDLVIFHLASTCDVPVYRTTGDPIPQAVLTIPETVQRNIDWLIHREEVIPCLSRIQEIESIHMSLWLTALLCERMERKTNDIFRLLNQYNDDWNEVFYIILTRAFGFGVNNDAFEYLAKSIPFRCIQRQRNSNSQIESMLFGQAGMLHEPVEDDDHYFRLLLREYKFFRHKFGLHPLSDSLFQSLRMRPNSFPHIRLAQLAALWVRYDTLFSIIRDEENLDKIKELFRICPSDYWETHYHFRYASTKKEKYLRENAINTLIINAVIPMLFAFGQKNDSPEYGERALRFLESTPTEKNAIVSSFCQAGISAHHAGDSQALIQLRKEYCEKKKCLSCRIGFQLLKHRHL